LFHYHIFQLHIFKRLHSCFYMMKLNDKQTIYIYVCVCVCIVYSRDSSVGIALGYGLDDRGSRVRFLAWAGNFFSTTASRTNLGPTSLLSKWVTGALSLRVKRPGREVDHSSPSSAEVKDCVELYLHSHNALPWLGAQLKHRDNFTFTLIYIIWHQ
jgi:hypothetical protein